MTAIIMAASAWPTNAHLIEAVHQLGYINDEDAVLDPTYGLGKWWSRWKPANLVAHDLYTLDGVDFTNLPHGVREFDVVAFDPPYKLNGTGSQPDERYGVHRYAAWQERHALIRAGMTECVRVLKPKGRLLVRCQDQVCGGKVRWQTIEFANHGHSLGLDLVDTLYRLGSRAQPAGRTQQHARRNMSALLVFEKP